MTGPAPIIILLGAAGVILAALLYLRVEPGVPGRIPLLGLRAGSLTIVTLLILGLEIPGDDPSRPVPEGGKWLLVDPDLSLTIPGVGGASLWDEVVDRTSDSGREEVRLAVALPGDGGPEGIELGALAARTPRASSANLRVAVSRLAEAGADSVVILSTLRRSPEDLEALAAETPIPIRLERLGGLARNVGIGELDLPASASPEEELSGRLSLFGEGGAPGDSVSIELRADGELIRIISLPMPSPGEELSVPFTLAAPPDTGLVRYTARGLLEGDVFPPDDLRTRWVVSGRADRGILLVSLRPDWEPRILLPVLKAVTGLEGEGYLRLGDGRFLPLASGAEPARPVEAEFFRDRMSGAELLVIQGDVERPPAWLVAAVETHPRVLHLPGTQSGAALAGLEVDSVLAGEWSTVPELPASPLSPFLAGISLGGLPPLSGLLPLAGPIVGTTGLNAQGPRGGEFVPALVLLDGDLGRRAVTLADGFWRWGMRDGESRRAYRALWGGVTGWLLAYSTMRGGEAVGPETLLQSRGEPLRWEVGSNSSGLELSLTRVHDAGDGSLDQETDGSPDVLFRGPLQAGNGLVATTPPVEPGIYRFAVRQPGTLPDDSVIASGVVEVERWAASLKLPPLDVPGGVLPAAGGEGVRGLSGSRPLRTHPLPYLILLILLGIEWVGRQRVGLR